MVLVNLFLLLLVVVHVNSLWLRLLVISRATTTACIPPARANDLRRRHIDLLNRFFLISLSLFRLRRHVSLLSLLITLVIPASFSSLWLFFMSWLRGHLKALKHNFQS